MSRKLEYSYVKSLFESRGYRLLSDNYVSIDSKLLVLCPNNHLWTPTAHNFRRGAECVHCFNESGNGNIRHKYQHVKALFEKEGYRLLSDKYINRHQKLDVICPNGHRYSTTCANFKAGSRCLECYNSRRGKSTKLDYIDVKKFFESQNYKLLSKSYSNIYQKLDVICPNGHNWSVTWANFKNNDCRCAYCSRNVSKGELELYSFVKSFFPDAISGDRKLISPLELDIVIPSKKVAIEYCGLYWHSESVGKDRRYHLEKLNKCNQNGYRLITIFEDEWVTKKDIVKSILSSILNIGNLNIIYARECGIKSISTELAREFCNRNHIQGYSESSIKLGAFFGGDLVSVMTFSKPNISRNIKDDGKAFELTRFCSLINYRVVGIASKLLKYAIDNILDCKYLFTYSDRRWFSGSLYRRLGFIQERINPPSYWYVGNNSFRRYHRFNFRKSVLPDKLADFNPELTEVENMLNNGYGIVWDCGTALWRRYL